MGKGRNWDLAMNKFDVDIKRIPYQGETLTLLTFHLVLDNFYIQVSSSFFFLTRYKSNTNRYHSQLAAQSACRIFQVKLRL